MRIAELSRRARNQDSAELVVFPELAVTGLSDPAASAQPIPGPATSRLQEIAAEHDVYLVCGLAEKAGGALFNSACLIAPDGNITVYRKIHLTQAEQRWAQHGAGWSVVDTPLGRIGLLIGRDASFPESGRVLALRGCDIIACPAAIKGRSARHMWDRKCGSRHRSRPVPIHITGITSGAAPVRTTCSSPLPISLILRKAIRA